MASAPPPASLEPPFPEDAVEVARILGAWGVKGWVKLQPFAKDPQALFSAKRWFVKPPDGPSALPPGGWPHLLRVVQAKTQGDGVVAALQDMDDRAQAEALRGARIFVPRSSFPTAGDDEFYWVDLIGLSVRNRDGVCLGVVMGLLDTGVHSVLRVQAVDSAVPGTEGSAESASERLIPFVGAYIDRVDLPGGCIHVDWGLDY